MQMVHRCGMNPSSLFDMKHSIVRAVADYVDIEAEELVEVICLFENALKKLPCLGAYLLAGESSLAERYCVFVALALHVA